MNPTIFQSLAGLIAALSALLGTPQLAHNPQALQAARAITAQTAQVIQLAETLPQYTTSTVAQSVGSSPAPDPSSTPLMEPSSTPENPVVPPAKEVLSIDTVIPLFIVNPSADGAYFDVTHFNPAYTPFEITISTENQSVSDPAVPDGLGLNLHFKELQPSTTYPYTAHLEGATWTADTSGTFTTLPVVQLPE